MKAILINLMTALFFLVGCSHAQPNKNAGAKTLTDQAEQLIRNDNSLDRSESYKSGLSLLNQAIKKDSNYKPAYEEKLLFQTALKQLDGAAVTAKQLVILEPNSDFIAWTAGKAIERVGDTTTARDYYKKALVLNSSLLDTMKVINDKFRFEKESRAIILILLNQPEKAHRILQQLFDSEKTPWRKEHYEEYLYMERHELVFGGTPSSIIKRIEKEKQHKSN